MKCSPRPRNRGFTLIEIMMAMAIFGLVLVAIYASWTLIIKSAQLGLEASARIQRERIALGTIEEALGCVRSFQADPQHYGFVAENNDGGMLSFVAQLPESFPRGGRFGDFDVRRVSFSLERGGEAQSQLVLRQNPILMEMDQDERDHPLVLAKGVDKMEFEFWDDRKKDWVDDWTATNQLPKVIKLTLGFVRQSAQASTTSFASREEVSRIIQLPSVMVPTAVQRPGPQAGQSPGGGVPDRQPGPPAQHGKSATGDWCGGGAFSPMKALRSREDSGIALIIVMVCITVLSILAAGFAYSMKVETKLAMNANNEAELISIGKSGVALAQWLLAQQLTIAQEPYDSLNQKWAGGPGSMMTSNSPIAEISLDNVPLGNGSFSLKIVDMERKMNINMADQPLLDQAMRLIGVDAGDAGPITASILDWMSPDKNALMGGTESSYYQKFDPPYEAKDGPIDNLSELLLVRGISEFPEIYWGGVASDRMPSAFQNKLGLQPGGQPRSYGIGLVDLFTPLSSGRINLNTASMTTLQMIPFVDENIAARIIECRSGPDGQDGTEDDTPFRNPGEGLLCGGLNNAVVGQVQRYCDVRSRVFEVQVDAQINGYHRYFYATVLRNSPRDVQVLTFHWKFKPPAPNPNHANAG